MKRTAVTILLSSILACAILTGCETTTTSTSNVTISTTDENGTKEYNYTEEYNNGVVTTETTVTETSANNETENDESVYYQVDPEEGVIYVTAPNNDDYWWEVAGDTTTIALDGWEVEDGIYYGRCSTIINEGDAHVIVAGYDDPEGAPYGYLIIPVTVKDSKITELAGDSVYVDTLDEYFGSES